MRRWTLIALILAAFLTLKALPARAQPASLTFAAGSPACSVDGQVYQLQPVPVVINGRIFVPLRGLAGILNAGLQWDPAKQEASFSLVEGSRKLTASVTLGSNTLTVSNGPGPGIAAQFIHISRVDLGAPPPDRSGCLLLPLRPLFQALGYQVVWQPATRTALLAR
jgi:hypothetical protein